MSKWLLTSNNQGAKYRLFCFPHAGSGSTKYLKWANYLDNDIEVCPVMLPGRESRVNEPCIENFEEMIDAVFEGIKENIMEKRYSLYGHSMGSILVYELAKRIEREGMQMPDYIFLSGSSLLDNLMQRNWKEVSDEAMADYLCSSGGTPRDLIDNEVFKEVFFPVLRSDHCVVSSYHYQPQKLKYNTNIHVFAAKDDNIVNVKYSENIRVLTDNFKISYFYGGHFFNYTNTKEICSLINEDLADSMLI